MGGRYVVEALERTGHGAVALTRSRGVEIVSGDGLDDALAGVEAVVGTMSTPEPNAEAARKFFGTTTRNLLAADDAEAETDSRFERARPLKVADFDSG